jgi:hypothetical protein
MSRQVRRQGTNTSRHSLPNCSSSTLTGSPANTMRTIKSGQTVQEVIDTIAKLENLEIDGLLRRAAPLCPKRSSTTVFRRATGSSDFHWRSDLPSSPCRALIRGIYPALPFRRLAPMFLPLPSLFLPALPHRPRFALSTQWPILIRPNCPVPFRSLHHPGSRAYGR